MPERWTTTHSEIAPDGAYVELRYAEFGKGKARMRSWKLFRDGFQAGYAANEADAVANYHPGPGWAGAQPGHRHLRARPAQAAGQLPDVRH